MYMEMTQKFMTAATRTHTAEETAGVAHRLLTAFTEDLRREWKTGRHATTAEAFAATVDGWVRDVGEMQARLAAELFTDMMETAARA